MYSQDGKQLSKLTSTPEHHGHFEVNAADGSIGVVIQGRSMNDTGGLLTVANKTEEKIVTIRADEYGNGVVGAWNRKGEGRTLTPGP